MSRLPKRIYMLGRAFDVRKQRHVIDVHFAQRNQTFISIVIRNLDLGKCSTARFVFELLLHIGFEIRLPWHSDE